MKHLYILKAAVLLLKTAFVAIFLLAIWLASGIAEAPELWYLYIFAAVVAFACDILLVQIILDAEDDLKRIEARRKAVPVPKIERRHGA